jgi:hypothetical protein
MIRRSVWEFVKFTPTSLVTARELFRKVTEIAPNAAEGHLWLGRVSVAMVAYDWTDPTSALREGMTSALHAVPLDDRNPYAHYSVAATHTFGGALGDEQQAARALDEMQAAEETKSDLTRLIYKFTPAWGEHIDMALARHEWCERR